MKSEFDDILNSLPDKPPRSRLEPYRDLIEELRQRKRTFQEIAEVLAAKCGVQVTGSGIHDYLRRRRQPTMNRVASLSVGPTTPKVDGARRRMVRLKDQKPVSEDLGIFDFDPGEPLRLAIQPKTPRQ
jgi:hypothetical protein